MTKAEIVAEISCKREQRRKLAFGLCRVQPRLRQGEISRSTGIERDAALKVVEKFMEVVKDSLASGENVYLRGFFAGAKRQADDGTFLIKERAEKTGRNISKGEAVVIPAHKIPAFKPSDDFKSMVK